MRRWPAFVALALAGCSPALIVGGPADVAGALPGSVLRLEPGLHHGPILVDRPLTLVGGEDVVVIAPAGGPGILVEGAEGVSIRHLTVRGGEAGVVVHDSTRVAIEGVTVEGARRWGILARDSEVRVSRCRVGGLLSTYARGVEVINSELRPASAVEGCRVVGPVYEGIVSRFSKVRMLDNRVDGSTLRGVAINEMSMGRMERNQVSNSLGVAYACGDMSRCEMVDNRARGIGATDEGGRSAQGNGVAVQYHSQAFIHGLSTSEVEGRAVLALTESTLVPRPLSSTGVGSGAWGVVMVLLATVFVPLILSRISGVPWPSVMLTMALLVQLSHQLEHTIQVAQVYLFHSWQTHGLAGALFDQEWVHLGFNTILLAALAMALVGYGKERLATWRLRAPKAYLALAAATGIQGYHVVEHLVKIAQHVGTGAAPAPGVLGRALDLVWLHFGINLVVTAALAVGYLGLRITDDLARGRRNTGGQARPAVAERVIKAATSLDGRLRPS